MRSFLAKLSGLLLFAGVGTSSFSQTLFRGPNDRKIVGSIYAESLYTQDYGFLSGGKLKGAYLFTENWNAYLGVSFLRQDRLANDPRFYTNSFSPLLGVQGSFFDRYIGVFAEARLRWDENDSYSKSHWDPRIGIYSGRLYYLTQQANPIFAEYYAESIFVPDIDGRPVTSGWAKAGMRFMPPPKIFTVDLYSEFYASQSYNPNLGRDIAQVRLGTRLIYRVGKFSAQGLFYYTSENNAEALFVLGGTF